DMERSTELARKSILRWGLSPAWGPETAPPQMSLEDYISTELTEGRRALFEKEKTKMLKEARALAKKALLSNYDALIGLGNELSAKGKMNRGDLDRFYATQKLYIEGTKEFDSYLRTFWGPTLMARMEPYKHRRLTRNSAIRPDLPKPVKIADIGQIYLDRKADQTAEVGIPENIPLVKDWTGLEQVKAFLANRPKLMARKGPGACENLLKSSSETASND
ncbi:MAG: hypothetical protein WCG27_04865, partial [Pseudomonadota bacterium]